MSKFLSSLETEEISDSENSGRGSWKLMSDLLYQSDIAKMVIKVPAGFITDYASVPRLPIVFLFCGDTASKAAVIHDYLYRSGILPRNVCDAVLREAAVCDNVPKWRAFLLWSGVRMFGGWFYRSPPSEG